MEYFSERLYKNANAFAVVKMFLIFLLVFGVGFALIYIALNCN